MAITVLTVEEQLSGWYTAIASQYLRHKWQGDQAPRAVQGIDLNYLPDGEKLAERTQPL